MLRRNKTLNKIRPTAGELEILGVLWQSGPSTVRDVFETIAKNKSTQYTTILKLMQIMHQKGLLVRNEKEKAHIYRAAQSQEQTQTNVVTDLLDKVFQGSAAKLVQHVLETKAASPEEIAEIRRMITEAEGEKK
ncbi:MAG TPA: BlaI/MecI/CopY family transcriptional regulator [Pyrinomonadaceae bacterium]|jgi:predicted transcriptional regulator|nr:BlaI/MecI/CopY family transcriptional regulator [Pyrinomonadaceae bacterium]